MPNPPEVTSMTPAKNLIAAGIDLGGTKIEAQLFDADWQVVERNRIDTPKDYPALVLAVRNLIAWADQAAPDLPIGIGAAGLVHPQTGQVLAANISAHGHPFVRDIQTAAQRDVVYLNDSRAFTVSEAVFGAGRGHATVLALILGTGVGGGIARGGQLAAGPTGTGGEFGHTSAPAALIQQHTLPILPCGCGRDGCIETLIAGPGLTRIAQALTGSAMTPREVAANRDAAAKPVWDVWIALVAELLRTLTLTVDPDIFVLGGGLSKMDGLTDALAEALQAVQFTDFPIAPVVLAEGGDTSGARGAAYTAWAGAQ